MTTVVMNSDDPNKGLMELIALSSPDEIHANTFLRVLFVPFYCFMFFILMYLMSSTADEYLSPALEFITVKFNIPESLAGVTLLAFGNGAPDVFSSISSGDDNAINSMSPLFGSSLFITTVVIFLVTRAGVNGSVPVNKKFFIRDLIVFMLMECYLLFILLVIKKITIPIAFSFLGIYTIYVILVCVQAIGD
jgi:sodium/potassium/calcium exchanger 6